MVQRAEDFVPLNELNQANEPKQEPNQDVEMVPEQLEIVNETSFSNHTI